MSTVATIIYDNVNPFELGVATRCGFSSAATLRLHFRRFLRLSPQSYRATFHSASA